MSDLFELIELRGRQKQLEADLAVLDGAAKEFADAHSEAFCAAFLLAGRKLLDAWAQYHAERTR